MGFSTTNTALLFQGLPYLALMLFSAGQFLREREPSRFQSLLTFTSATLSVLLCVVGNVLARNELLTAALLMERLSLVSLHVSIYALFLLASNFTNLLRWLTTLASVGVVFCSAATLLAPGRLIIHERNTLALSLPLLQWVLDIFVLAGSLIVAFRFGYASRQFTGATRQRLQLISIGAALLFLSLAVFSLIALASVYTMPLFWLGWLLLLFAGLAFLPAFAPPTRLRRFWMLPELERITQLSSNLILNSPQQGLSSDAEGQTEGLRQMLQRALYDLGAEGGIVQLWDPAQQRLESAVTLLTGEQAIASGSKPVDEELLVEAFNRQQAMLRPGATRRLYLLRKRANGSTILAAPLVAEGRTLGVLGIARPIRSLFAEDDLILIRLFANQMAQWLVYQRHLQDTATLLGVRTEQALKDEFIAVIAHELRTPLTVLKGRLQLLRRQLNKEGLTAAAEEVARLDGPYNRLNQLISTLLDLSYLDTDRLQLLRHPLDLSGLVRKVVEGASSARPVELDLAGARVTDEAGSSLPAIVLGDSARLEQVLNNLLDNARKYSPEESSILVRLERRVGSQEVVVSVRDFGVGIQPEDQPRLFQRWSRAANSSMQNYRGVGLGLYLSAEIISRQGGRIWVESTGVAGEGSTFRFSLPLISPQEIASFTEPPQSPTRGE